MKERRVQMTNERNRGLLFGEKLLSEIRDKFYFVDVDGDGSKRLFFENAGGSLRLKSVIDISNELNKYPDCFARDHKSSLILHQYEIQGKEDVRTLLNAKDGAIATSLTASSIMFEMIGPMVAYGNGTNIVTTEIEHPSAYDSCKYYARKYNKELRVAQSDRQTGGLRPEDVLNLIDKETLLLNVIISSNMTGANIDLKTICTEARLINPDIFIVTDAVQHAPHGLIDVNDLKVDGLNIAPYKFYGNRGIAFAYISERVKNLPHHRILEDSTDLWELGSIVPAHYGAISKIVEYISWIGSNYTDSKNKRTLVEEGMKRIRLQEQALLYRLLHGSEKIQGLLSMNGVDTFFDYTDLDNRDLILAMKLDNLGCFETVREYEKRGIIVYERVSSSIYSKRIIESFGLNGIVRVSPLHCNTVDEIDQFLRVTQKILISIK
ncbi:MAG: aminotransferase class V-fold PLP-dependent enzyme [Firmicutes bacterium]|nr:aminotransferase class V-fold PLP-dependent enzyme [Bacillota bacterium]